MFGFFASIDAVYFEYRDSERLNSLDPFSKGFHGVLISDFFNRVTTP